jgi:cation transport ATPase
MQDGEVVGLLGVSDTLRSEVPAALKAIRTHTHGITQVELLTGDNERAARALAG